MLYNVTTRNNCFSFVLLEIFPIHGVGIQLLLETTIQSTVKQCQGCFSLSEKCLIFSRTSENQVRYHQTCNAKTSFALFPSVTTIPAVKVCWCQLLARPSNRLCMVAGRNGILANTSLSKLWSLAVDIEKDLPLTEASKFCLISGD